MCQLWPPRPARDETFTTSKAVDVMDRCFALLDDRDATRERPTSRLYTGFVREHRCVAPATLDATWARVDADLRAGLHALVLADYEWGAKLLKAGHRDLAPDDRSALRVLVFTELTMLSHADVDDLLERLETRTEASAVVRGAVGVMHLEASVDQPAFTRAIDRIHAAIQAGETYQVNYTYRLHGQAYGSPVGLYRRLRARQPVAFGAFIQLPTVEEGGAPDDATTHVLSCSPELFLRHDAGLLTARPMKGTASRIRAPEADSETARHLSLDIKNRAENLMIVDLLRNDLGRVAQIGSVKVPDLFAIEPYSTVFQMTSTVQARVRPDVGFPELLRAVFPCGSITGAPKHHTMELIAELESTPRGLYCGAIGWLDAPRGDALLGDFCLSVTIRTMTLGAEVGGLRPARLGIGAGIVLDSRADDEFEECRLKARFLTGLPPGFELFETMLATAPGGVQHLDRHLARLARSAEALGFAFDGAEARYLVDEQLRAWAGAHPMRHRLRLSLAHDGQLKLTHAALAEMAPAHDGVAVTLLIADHRLPNRHPLSAHKTTLRQHYDDGVRAAEREGAFDSLFFTEDGRLVEGGRTSVFVKLDGRWYTPPVTDGALPGVMRGWVLEDPAWRAVERSLSRDDLDRAEAIMVCNALRGTLPARVITAQPMPAANTPAAA
jgi:para-aminobenzoate synthetase/4-amino-4-deoxychorismate lyase